MEDVRYFLEESIVDGLAIERSRLPVALESVSYLDVSRLLCDYGLGIVFIVDRQDRLKGVVTDGDVRRAFSKHGPMPMFTLKSEVFATIHPKYCRCGNSLLEVLRIMEQPEKRITCLPVVDDNNKLLGAVTLHSIVSSLLDMI